MRNFVRISALLAVLSITGANGADLRSRANHHFDPLPETVGALKDNPVTAEKVSLGKQLFFDPRLSASGVISCNTCHNLGMGGDDNLTTSIGHGWQKGPRNSPTVFNAVLNAAQFWDGRAEDLKDQAKGPVQAGIEMNSTPDLVVKVLSSIPEYREAFAKAFPEQPQAVNFDNMAKAIEAFEATLLTPNSRFDRWLKGDETAMNDQEKQGLKVFLDEGCAKCHYGVNLGGQDYYPFGLVERPGAEILPPEDKGRFNVTKTASDEYVFRAPPLRNVELTAPYFHSGRVWSLKQAVAVMGAFQLGAALTDEAEEAMVAFLHTLTGEQPKVEYPILPPSTWDTPRPRF